jgi:hypothetical protein
MYLLPLLSASIRTTHDFSPHNWQVLALGTA